MEQKQLDIYRQRLLAEKEELASLMEDSAESAKPVTLDQTMVGRVSRIDAIQQQEMALASARRRAQRGVMIDQALARAESGDYGYCVSCDEEISPRRLDLDPAIPICIQCAGT
ncbi:MAG: TraR/DksA C4-type zinc finger protein [Alphaproteobacteria bacterium]|nr:TraR/DksA C4-type zinc finger protein [Alphaproteobacteria bacterium]